jgi:hypothetical protein
MFEPNYTYMYNRQIFMINKSITNAQFKEMRSLLPQDPRAICLYANTNRPDLRKTAYMIQDVLGTPIVQENLLLQDDGTNLEPAVQELSIFEKPSLAIVIVGNSFGLVVAKEKLRRTSHSGTFYPAYVKPGQVTRITISDDVPTFSVL